MINKNKLALVVGSFLGIWHLSWSVLVAIGFAQWLIDWVFRLHFIEPLYRLMPFRLSYAIALVALTSTFGYVIGWVMAALWNWVQTDALKSQLEIKHHEYSHI